MQYLGSSFEACSYVIHAYSRTVIFDATRHMANTTDTEMSSNKPYLMRALYQWICDNNKTPHLMVDASYQGVKVPANTVQKGKVVLNISPTAADGLDMGDDMILFSGRFSGVSYPICVPTASVMAIYARENGQGMMFPSDDSEPPPSPIDEPETIRARPQLTIVK